MLSFAMVTRNEGCALDGTLQALHAAMSPGDHLVAIDAGSTDGTVARLADFAERAPATIFQLDVQEVSRTEAMILALDADRSDYVMWLGPRDQPQSQALSDLRAGLKATSPDLAVVNSGWWDANPDHGLDRTDAHVAATLSRNASGAALLQLCPDPRRLVMARTAQAHLRPLLSGTTGDAALYAALVGAASRPAFIGARAVLHVQDWADPSPQLGTLVRLLQSDRVTDDAVTLGMIRVWVDDAILRTPADRAAALCAQLQAVWQAVPSGLQDPLETHEGPSGTLFAALHRAGVQDAMLHFALSKLARQQERMAHLAAEYTHLRHSVQTALPGPDYLRRLYDRARNI